MCPGNLSPGKVVNPSVRVQWFSSGHPDTTPYVVQIDVPAGIAPGTTSQLDMVEYTSPFDRDISVSKTPCDFSNLISTAASGITGLNLKIAYDQATFDKLAFQYKVLLTPGTWFVNMRSAPGSCPVSYRAEGCTMNLYWISGSN
jgi:hypothetical protein